MKKVLLLLFSFMIVANTMAQNQHLKFMGIPINGTIDSFQAKLKNKGVTLSKSNSSIPAGVRGFNGTFAGKKCNIYVYYNSKNRIVYACRAVVDCYSKDNALSVFDYYKDLLSEKYSGKALTSDMLEENPSAEDYTFLVVEEPVREGSALIGSINIDIIDYDFSTDYGVRVHYEDITNSDKNKDSNLNDL